MSQAPPDNILLRPMLIMGIVLLVLGIIMAAMPLGLVLLVAGIGFIILGVMCIIFYVIKPEPLRQKYLEKWENKQAKKA